MGLVIATYWWQPDKGSKFKAPYGAGDVRRLQSMVARHLTVPHEFAVITDRPEEFAGDRSIRAIPIDWATHVPGRCFVRLMTFHPRGAEIIGERVLQIDLDTLIVGNIDHLVNRSEELVLWRNPSRVPWDKPTMPGRPYYNTSLLLHRCGTFPEVYTSFDPNIDPSHVRDDQWWISELGPEMPYFDGARDGVYRIAREETPGSGVWGDLPGNACIVTFPGSSGKPSDPKIRASNPWIEHYFSEGFCGWA